MKYKIIKAKITFANGSSLVLTKAKAPRELWSTDLLFSTPEELETIRSNFKASSKIMDFLVPAVDVYFIYEEVGE